MATETEAATASAAAAAAAITTATTSHTNLHPALNNHAQQLLLLPRLGLQLEQLVCLPSRTTLLRSIIQ
jgi:hypothetical protein